MVKKLSDPKQQSNVEKFPLMPVKRGIIRMGADSEAVGFIPRNGRDVLDCSWQVGSSNAIVVHFYRVALVSLDMDANVSASQAAKWFEAKTTDNGEYVPAGDPVIIQHMCDMLMLTPGELIAYYQSPIPFEFAVALAKLSDAQQVKLAEYKRPRTYSELFTRPDNEPMALWKAWAIYCGLDPHQHVRSPFHELLPPLCGLFDLEAEPRAWTIDDLKGSIDWKSEDAQMVYALPWAAPQYGPLNRFIDGIGYITNLVLGGHIKVYTLNTSAPLYSVVDYNVLERAIHAQGNECGLQSPDKKKRGGRQEIGSNNRAKVALALEEVKKRPQKSKRQTLKDVARITGLSESTCKKHRKALESWWGKKVG